MLYSKLKRKEDYLKGGSTVSLDQVPYCFVLWKDGEGEEMRIWALGYQGLEFYPLLLLYHVTGAAQNSSLT